MNDFSDKIPVILVKELREMLRSKLFIISFMVFHLAMFLFMLLGVFIATVSNQASSSNSGFFWVIMTVMLHLYLPIMASRALYHEVKTGNMELYVLTSLTTRNIMWSKWLAFGIQSFIFAVTSIPYLAFLFVFFNTDLLGNLGFLFAQWVGAVLLIGLAICWSLVIQPLLRILGMIIIGFFLLFGVIGLLSAVYSRSFMSGDIFGISETVIELVMGIVFVGTVLEFSASRLGVPGSRTENLSAFTQNHELVMRFGGFLNLALGCALSLFLDNDALIIVFIILTLIVSCFGSLLREPFLMPRIVNRYKRLPRFLGVPARLFFFPGWQSGILYLFLSVTTAVACLGLFFDMVDNQAILFLPAMFGFMLLPLLFNVLMKVSEPVRPYMWIIFHLVFSVLAAVLITMDEFYPGGIFKSLISMVPLVDIPILMDNLGRTSWPGLANSDMFFRCMLPVICLIILSGSVVRFFRQLKDYEYDLELDEIEMNKGSKSASEE